MAGCTQHTTCLPQSLIWQSVQHVDTAPFHTCSTCVGEVLCMFTDRAPVWEKLYRWVRQSSEEENGGGSAKMEGENRSWRGCNGEGGRQVGGGHVRDWAHSGVRTETLHQCSAH